MTDEKDLKTPTLPDHESGVRRMVADAAGRPYRAFHTLAEAQGDPDGIVVFEGDYGGQIYVVFWRPSHCSVPRSASVQRQAGYPETQ